MKIEEWPSKAKWGQAGQTGPNGAKWCQTGSNGAKRGKNGQKRALRGQTGPKGPNKAKWGHMGLIFHMHAYFYEIKKSCLAELWGFC